jgi:GNAT superfamily N-acetyltransferase
MKLLDPSQHDVLAPLVPDEMEHLAVSAIVAGAAHGHAYVDDVVAPSVALLSPHWGRLYLLGRSRPAVVGVLRETLAEQVWPAALEAGSQAFSLTYPPDWQPVMAQVLEGRSTVLAERQHYRWPSSAPAPSEIEHHPLPDGFSLRLVDERLVTGESLAGLALLWEEMVSERASVDDFLARSFGIVAVCERQLAGWCLSEYNLDGRCEVGIATLEPYQRRGLATAMGRAFLRHAVSQGIREIGWHCWKRNVASAATALKIGLAHVADYPVYFGWYNEGLAPS